MDREIILSAGNEVLYQAITQELAKRSKTVQLFEQMEMGYEILPPRECIYRVPSRKSCTCLVTGETINRNDRAILIFARPKIGQMVIIGVIKDENALLHLLQLGSLKALRHERK